MVVRAGLCDMARATSRAAARCRRTSTPPRRTTATRSSRRPHLFDARLPRTVTGPCARPRTPPHSRPGAGCVWRLARRVPGRRDGLAWSTPSAPGTSVSCRFRRRVPLCVSRGWWCVGWLLVAVPGAGCAGRLAPGTVPAPSRRLGLGALRVGARHLVCGAGRPVLRVVGGGVSAGCVAGAGRRVGRRRLAPFLAVATVGLGALACRRQAPGVWCWCRLRVAGRWCVGWGGRGAGRRVCWVVGALHCLPAVATGWAGECRRCEDRVRARRAGRSSEEHEELGRR